MRGHPVSEGWEVRTYLLRGDRLLAGLAELLDGLVVVTQILLAADENDGKTLAEVQNFGNPLQEQTYQQMAYQAHDWHKNRGWLGWAHLLLYVVQGIRRVNSKADQDNVGVGV